jgi:hypothetical protein
MNKTFQSARTLWRHIARNPRKAAEKLTGPYEGFRNLYKKWDKSVIREAREWAQNPDPAIAAQRAGIDTPTPEPAAAPMQPQIVALQEKLDAAKTRIDSLSAENDRLQINLDAVTAERDQQDRQISRMADAMAQKPAASELAHQVQTIIADTLRKDGTMSRKGVQQITETVANF